MNFSNKFNNYFLKLKFIILMVQEEQNLLECY